MTDPSDDKSLDKVKGSLKEALGKLTGDKALEARGAGEKNRTTSKDEPAPARPETPAPGRK